MSPPTRVCPSCETPLPAEAGFCPSCGEATPTEISGETGVTRVESSDTGEREYRERLQRALGDGYELRDLIGRGGFGVVYAAWDVKLEREVAVKALRHDLFPTSALVERFEREAKSVAKLRHPNILPILFVGEGDGITYMVMPKIEGESLRAMLQREGQLSVDEATRIATEVAEALQTAHDANFIHRDVKPENILLEGDRRRVLLMDFGIAKALEKDEATLTVTGAAVGSPLYMSPEQAGGDKRIDYRSDIYSLGCVLYEMLAGEPPFTGQSAQALVAKHISERAPSLEIVRPGLATHIYGALQKALAKVPADRFATALDFGDGLNRKHAMADGRRAIRSRWLLYALPAVTVLVASIGLFTSRGRSGPVAAPVHRQLTFTGEAAQAAISLDGSFVAYTSKGSLWVQDLAGGDPLQVTDSSRGIHSPQWSPDGTEILYAHGHVLRSVPRLGGTSRVVAGYSRFGGPFFHLPNGRLIRYERSRDRSTEWLITQDVSGSGASDTVNVAGAPLGIEHMQPSPDGQWLAVATWGPDGNSAIALVSRDGRTVDTLVSGLPSFAYQALRWNAAGDALYYLRPSADGLELANVPIDVRSGGPAGDPRTVMSGISITNFDVSADGKRLVYK